MAFNIKNFFRTVKSKFQGKASLEDLIKNMPKGYQERSKHIGEVKFVGYKFTYKQDKGLFSKIASFLQKLVSIGGGAPIIHVLLKFESLGSMGRNGGREKYNVYLEMPFSNGMEKENLLVQPVKVYCECDSFKYFMAFALESTDQVYLTESIKSNLGIALTQEPKIRNPSEIKFLCKHLFKVVNYAKNKRLEKLLETGRKLK